MPRPNSWQTEFGSVQTKSSTSASPLTIVDRRDFCWRRYGEVWWMLNSRVRQVGAELGPSRQNGTNTPSHDLAYRTRLGRMYRGSTESVLTSGLGQRLT